MIKISLINFSTRRKKRSVVLTKQQYLMGLLVIFVAAYSQYFIPGLNLFRGLWIVYGAPLAFMVFVPWAREILKSFFKNTSRALQMGFASFGVWSLIGLFAAMMVFVFLKELDPASVSLLSKSDPVLNVSPKFAWLMVWVSILVVGPAEEFIFRGFIFGGLLQFFKNRYWIILALISSFLFAGAHLYYSLVYGLSSLTIFVNLFAFGMAMAFVYYLSGGNLFAPALIHGLYDAAGFVAVAGEASIGTSLRSFMIVLGILIAFVLIVWPDKKGRVIS